ncbi:MAG: zinc-dependent alcohol dehydrogenase [Thermoleophilia bacterium]
MRAVRLMGPKEVRIEEIPDPVIQEPGDAILRVTRTAICGADLLPYWGYVPGFEWGTTLGHEFVGIVEEVGSGVARIKPGDRVLASSTTSCGNCWFCRHGMASQCEQLALFGYSGVYPRLDGGQADKVRVPEADRVLWLLPESVSDEAGVFVADILSTAYRGVERANVKPGDTVVVVGCGPVGLMSVLVSGISAGTVIAVDPLETRRAAARDLGAIPLAAGENVVERVFDLTGGRGADAVIETAGAQPALLDAMKMVRGRGTVSVIGAHFEPDCPMDLGTMFARETTLCFSIGSPTDDREEVIRLIETGRVDPVSTVSHRMSLAAAEEAYRMFAEREATKIVLLAD